MPDIIRSAYATLVVTDLAEARRFWVDLLGFVVTDEDSSALYLRGYDELTHHNLIVAVGPAGGGRARSASASGRRLTWTGRRRTTRRSAAGPSGCPPGRCAGSARSSGWRTRWASSSTSSTAPTHPERLQQRYDLRRGAEVARLDHFNICVPDVPRAQAYYSGLGFGLSETIEDDQTVYAAWMYRKQTVHDVAFTGGAGPRLHHLGFFAHEPHSVLRICDIIGSLHLEECIERGPGRHGVSNAFYVYLRDPDGHRLEIYTSDYYTGDPDHPVLRWSVRDPRRRDFWGNAVIPSWYSEASPVLDLDGKVRPVTELAQTAEVTVGADGFTAPAE